MMLRATEMPIEMPTPTPSPTATLIEAAITVAVIAPDWVAVIETAPTVAPVAPSELLWTSALVVAVIVLSATAPPPPKAMPVSPTPTDADAATAEAVITELLVAMIVMLVAFETCAEWMPASSAVLIVFCATDDRC